MAVLPADTSLDIEHLHIDWPRQMPPWRKLAPVCEMIQSIRALALAGLRQRFPDDTRTQRQRRLADLSFGPGLAVRVCGPLAEDV
jgi:hypothetical protein